MNSVKKQQVQKPCMKKKIVKKERKVNHEPGSRRFVAHTALEYRKFPISASNVECESFTFSLLFLRKTIHSTLLSSCFITLSQKKNLTVITREKRYASIATLATFFLFFSFDFPSNETHAFTITHSIFVSKFEERQMGHQKI